jgi:hypothetical protein
MVVPLILYAIKRLRGDGNWPTVPGTVFGWGIKEGAGRSNPFAWRSQLGHLYTVNGVDYHGKFVVVVKDDSEARWFQAACPGKHVTVRYNPSNPKFAFVDDLTIYRKESTQYPLMLW